MMLQLNPTLPVATPLGDGEAFLVIDYGPDVNTVYAVRLAGGVVKHLYSDDIRLYGNPMNGEGWDVDVPPDWPRATAPSVLRTPLTSAIEAVFHPTRQGRRGKTK